MAGSTTSIRKNGSLVNRSSSPSICARASSHETDDPFSRKELLKVLASQTLAQFEIEGLSSSDGEPEEEEWGGIPNEDGSVDDDDYSIAASDEDFDDGEDLFLRAQKSLSSEPQTPRQGPEVIVFQDPSKASSNDPDCDTTSFEKKSFMASMLQKQNRSAAPSGGSTTKRKRRLNQEDEEETKLEHLDRSLSNLVSHLSAPKKTSVSLDTILSSTLPPPTKGKNPQRHPRRIKEGMARVQLERSLAADKEALVSGTVRAKNSRTLTKRQKRAQDGTTERVRRARKALADRGSIGKTVGGGMIKLSSREIKMGMNGSKSRGKGFVGKG